jgi:hypothetical protein
MSWYAIFFRPRTFYFMVFVLSIDTLNKTSQDQPINKTREDIDKTRPDQHGEKAQTRTAQDKTRPTIRQTTRQDKTRHDRHDNTTRHDTTQDKIRQHKRKIQHKQHTTTYNVQHKKGSQQEQASNKNKQASKTTVHSAQCTHLLQCSTQKKMTWSNIAESLLLPIEMLYQRQHIRNLRALLRKPK